ncbi:MAG: TonB-dependent receptor [Ignavibacteriaceae bacterium]|nr:MAG: TonB-dependent receptor [Ignavibacteriaceae bacterium]
MTKKIITSLFFLLLTVAGSAQNFSVKGVIVDSSDGTPLPGSSVSLIPNRPGEKQLNMVTSTDGVFIFKPTQPGKYRLVISFIGYLEYIDSLQITRNQPTLDLGQLKLKRSALQMEEVEVTGVAIPSTQSEDTLSFSAKGYKTNPDATAEDLVTKLPGVQQEQGTLKAQGEEVKKVYVDGQPFFGDDPVVTLKNLPADMIDKIEIFDKMSDQTRFTGFDDGQTEKTINIVTKRDRREGQFGKLYGGYGSSEKFQSGGVVNFFGEGRRFSILGLGNNINRQNFSQQDLLGISQGGGGRGGHRGGFQGRGGGGGGWRGPGGAANNFLIGTLEGNTNTYSIGLNYQQNWAKDAVLTGSYFFNYSKNWNDQTINRDYFPTSAGLQNYDEKSSSNPDNYNHRLNFRLEWNIDSMNTIIATPRFSAQKNISENDYFGISMFDSGTNNSTDNRSNSDGGGFNFSNEIIYRTRFETPGRSLSISFNNGLNSRRTDRNQYSLNYFNNTNAGANSDTLNQKGDDLVKGYSYSGNFVYTEPFGANGQLMATISAGINNNYSDRQTLNFNNLTGLYDLIDPISSNKYDNNYYTYRGGLAYRLGSGAVNLYMGVTYQISQLTGDQSYPYTLTTEKKFYNFLPSVRFNYKISDAQNFRIFYFTSVNAPSLTQLQNFYDVSNPLFIRGGNPNLKDEYSNRVSIQYLTTDKESGANFFVMGFYQRTDDYIGNSSFTAVKDTLISDGVLLRKGAQFTISRNFGASQSVRGMLSGGFPVPFIKSNLSVNFGAGYSLLPAEYQRLITESKIVSLNQGITVASNISEDIDFKLSYSPSYYVSKNDVLPRSDDEYWVHSGSANLFFNVFDLFFVTTDYSFYKTAGIADNGDVSYSLWNAAIGVKFLEGNKAELRLDVFDILNQNKSFIRTATDIYIENKSAMVLKQFFMLSFTYNLKAF